MAIRNLVDVNGNIIEDELCAEPTSHGLMCPEDKLKLLGIEDGANRYIHPEYTPKVSGLYKITVDETGHVSDATLITKSDIVDLGIPGEDTNTTYNNASDTEAGLMSAEDKLKLDNIDAGANNFTYTHPSHTSYESGFYKIAINALGHVVEAIPVTEDDIVDLGIEGTTYTLTKVDNKIILSGSDGSSNEVEDTPYTHPSHTSYESGFYKIAINALGHVVEAIPVTKDDITSFGIPDTDHVHSEYVDISSEQTITGLKTFKESYMIGKSLFTWDDNEKAVVITFEE